MNAAAVQSITDEQLAEIESMLACDPQGSIYTDANELGGLIARLRAAEKDAALGRLARRVVEDLRDSPKSALFALTRGVADIDAEQERTK